ncbi:MAG: MXAN_5187 C-terminal domain-containing protein [Trichlorobacter sp.]|jgi:leucyl aminopeptidase|nr:MXAN_5187 C-terminal domain-containing protein [Trichlorobacter sp.]
MKIEEDLPLLESRLHKLITSYELYFLGSEKREPLQQLADVEQLVRRYAGVNINNTMYKHRYNNLVARFGSYRQLWQKTVREIEEGRYSRDRFKVRLKNSRQGSKPVDARMNSSSTTSQELDQIYNQLIAARKQCNLPTDKISRQQFADMLASQKPLLSKKLGTDQINFRVVVEDGVPRLKAAKATKKQNLSQS